MSLLKIVSDHLNDVSVLRRLLFAATHLSRELPNVWGVAVEFATEGKINKSQIDPKTAAALVEDIESFDSTAFEKDEKLIGELIGWKIRQGNLWESF